MAIPADVQEPAGRSPAEGVTTARRAARVVGAYAAAPPEWDAAVHDAFLGAVLSLPGCTGFEIPFTGTLHPHDEEWFLARIRPGQQHVLTVIPGTMGLQTRHPGAGLAAADADGRRHAIDFHRTARDAVARVNERAGEEVVAAVQINSAPTRRHPDPGTGAEFTEALELVAGWDWSGAALVVEHCDAPVADHPAQKGFLSLAAELAAVGAVRDGGSRTPLGVSINWARSAIEGRDTASPLEHARRVSDAGLLAGLMLSGCSDRASAYGDPRSDAHLPPAGVHVPGADEAHSLLTPRVAADFAACDPAGTVLFDGVKIGVRPAQASPQVRLSLIAATLAMLPPADMIL